MTIPKLSVVVVTPHRFAQLRRTVAHLRQQDAVEVMELIIVGPSAEALEDVRAEELEGFWDVQRVAVGPIANVDKASAHGILAAKAPVVAIVEDHAFPQPGWAAAIIEAYDDAPWAAVGSMMLNANPRSMLSWTNILLAYGEWMDPAAAGEIGNVAGHNATYRRDALEEFRPKLPDRLGRDGDLHDRLRARGDRLYLARHAAIAHLNPSRLSSTAVLRFNAGRLYGAMRRQEEGWSWLRRLLYILAGPLIPLIRLRRVHAEHLAGERNARLRPRIYPALLAGLLFDAAGQVAAYARGLGSAMDVLSTFEMDRIQHLNSADRREFSA